MIDDREIWQCANIIVKRYGKEAPIEAALRADSMLKNGDLDGQAIWKRILRATEELLREAPSSGEQEH